jgi:Mrp family chromosome partitioning ATPase
MVNIFEKTAFRLGIPVSGQTIMYSVIGVIVVILSALFLIILRRRKFKKATNISLTDAGQGGDKPAESSYEPIVKRIRQVKRKYRSILFASAEAESLPVTIPVNVAMRLAKSKKLCLLIDLDLKRDAVAKAFGLDANQSSLRAKAIQTEIENLWVWPSHYFSQTKHMNVIEIVEKAEDRFDFILINAPALLRSPDYKQITLAARTAFICGNNASTDMEKLTELMKSLDCTIIGRIQIP